MRLKSGFELVDVAGEHLIIPIGENAEKFQGVIALSEAAYYLLNSMKEDVTKQELVEILMKEYDVDSTKANEDINDFIKTMIDLGIVIDC